MSSPTMTQCKIDFVNTASNQGFSASLLLNSVSSGSVNEMLTLKGLAYCWSGILGSDTKITYLTCSQVGLNKDVNVKIFNTFGPGGLSAHPSLATMLKRKNATGTSTSTLYLRGLPLSCYNGAEFSQSNSAFNAWNAYYLSFKNYLINNAFGWLAVQAPTTKLPIATLVQNTGGTITITTSNNLFDAPSVGQKRSVSISAVAGAASVNGRQVVQVNSQTQFTTVKRIPILAWQPGTGYVNYGISAFTAVASMDFDRTVERKAGTPARLSRGRVRGKKLV